MALENCRQHQIRRSGHNAHVDQHGLKQGVAILTDAELLMRNMTKVGQPQCHKGREEGEGTECSPGSRE